MCVCIICIKLRKGSSQKAIRLKRQYPKKTILEFTEIHISISLK